MYFGGEVEECACLNPLLSVQAAMLLLSYQDQSIESTNLLQPTFHQVLVSKIIRSGLGQMEDPVDSASVFYAPSH